MKIKERLCLRCSNITKPIKNNNTKCSKCKKPYKWSKKEIKDLEEKVRKIKPYLDKIANEEITPQLEGHNWSVGGSDF